jgi:hypothetical protein
MLNRVDALDEYRNPTEAPLQGLVEYHYASCCAADEPNFGNPKIKHLHWRKRRSSALAPSRVGICRCHRAEKSRNRMTWIYDVIQGWFKKCSNGTENAANGY